MASQPCPYFFDQPKSCSKESEDTAVASADISTTTRHKSLPLWRGYVRFASRIPATTTVGGLPIPDSWKLLTHGHHRREKVGSYPKRMSGFSLHNVLTASIPYAQPSYHLHQSSGLNTTVDVVRRILKARKLTTSTMWVRRWRGHCTGIKNQIPDSLLRLNWDVPKKNSPAENLCLL